MQRELNFIYLLDCLFLYFFIWPIDWLNIFVASGCYNLVFLSWCPVKKVKTEKMWVKYIKFHSKKTRYILNKRPMDIDSLRDDSALVIEEYTNVPSCK